MDFQMEADFFSDPSAMGERLTRHLQRVRDNEDELAGFDASACATNFTEDYEAYPTLSEVTSSMFFVFEDKTGGNIYSKEGIEFMRDIELSFFEDPEFAEFCHVREPSDVCPGVVSCCDTPLSGIRFFYGDYEIEEIEAANEYLAENYGLVDKSLRDRQLNLTSVPTDQIEQAVEIFTLVLRMFDTHWAKDDTLSTDALGETTRNSELTEYHITTVLEFCAHIKKIASLRQYVDFFFDKRFDENNLESQYSRAVLSLGGPYEGYSDLEDVDDEQYDKLVAWFDKKHRDRLITNADADDRFGIILFASALSNDEFLQLLQWDVMLATISLVFVFLFIAFGSGSFYMAIMGMLEILWSLPIAWCIYFQVLGFSVVSGLATLTLYIVLAIGADDIFVFVDAYKQSLYEGPAVLRDFETRLSWTYNRAASAMLITSFTTMAAFVATAVSPLVSIASFGIFAALVILADYILVITWFCSTVILHYMHIESRGGGICDCCHCFCFLKKRSEDVMKSLKPADPAQVAPAAQTMGDGEAQGGGGAAKPKKRRIERFFENTMADFVLKRRREIVVGYCLVVLPMTYFAFQASAATKPNQFLPSDHPFQRFFDVSAGEFPNSSEEDDMTVTVVWGLDGVDRDGVNLIRDGDFVGEVMFTPGFRFDEAAQLHIESCCLRALDWEETSGFLVQDDYSLEKSKVDCFILDFKEWLSLELDMSFPVPENEAVGLLSDFVGSDVIPKERTASGEPMIPSRYLQNIGITRSNKELKFVSFVMHMDLKAAAFYAYPDLIDTYNLVEDFVNSFNSGAPSSASYAVQFAEYSYGYIWVYMRKQEVYVEGAITGCFFGLALSFAVLLVSTLNVLMSAIASFCIGGILLCVFGMMVVIGWELGNTESICLTILAGFAVDYVVHLAHAYMHKASAKREDRVRESLAEMGVSVLSGMLTSAGASLPLLMCNLVFFSKFGTFLITTVTLSWTVANFVFMAILSIVGPEPRKFEAPDGSETMHLQGSLTPYFAIVRSKIGM
jgi:predicted RND superfamily exporter protein